MRLLRSEAEHYTETLAPGERLCVQVFADKGGNPQLANQDSGAFARVWPWLVDRQREGCGAFLTVNACNGRRLAINVTRIRAYFCEFDGVAPPPAWHLPPSIVVQSKNGLHVYWLISDDAPLADFRRQQKRLAAHYGSDPVVCDLPRVLRIPGTAHLKGDAFLVRLLGAPGHRYPWQTIVADIAELPAPPKRTPQPRPDGTPQPKGKGDYNTLDLAGLFNSLGEYFSTLHAEKHAVRCPWYAEHTDARQGPFDTIIWQEPGRWPTFRCAHSHCRNRKTFDVIELVGTELADRWCAKTWQGSRAAAAFAEAERALGIVR